MTTMQHQVYSIGIVHSELKRLEDCPRQESGEAPPASIHVFAEYLECMKDIKAGDELIILTWLHLSDRNVLNTHPRNDPSLPLTGVFSTRSPDRPNPIGLHSVKVVAVEGEVIRVANLEVLDQTAVIDIKAVW